MILTDPAILAALNEHGFWHGRAADADVEEAPHVAELEDDPPPVFSGLYVTGIRSYARDMANARATFYESEPVLHRVYLLPGVELALDEDMLGATDTWDAWRHADPLWFRNITLHPLVASLLPEDTDEQLVLEYAGEEDEPDEDLQGDWSELDFDQWARDLVEPALRTWLPRGGTPPNLVILNDAFRADPPLPPVR